MTDYLQQERYARLDGRQVCYVDEGAGPVLLLVHGLGGSICNWTPTIEHFSKTRRVVALDLPGFGKSEGRGLDCTADCFLDAVLGLMDHLGITRAVVAGNSLGGLLSIKMALEHPDAVESLVLVDSVGTHEFPGLFKTAMSKLPERLVRKAMVFFVSYILRYRFAYRAAGIYNINSYTRALLDEQAGICRRPDLDDYMDIYYRSALTALGTRFDDRLGEIDKPVLIVWGQKDMGVPLKVGQRMNKLINGSFLVSIPDAAHVPQLDRPEAFNLALERFLAGAGAGEEPLEPRR